MWFWRWSLMKRFLFFHVQRSHGFGTAMVCDPPEKTPAGYLLPKYPKTNIATPPGSLSQKETRLPTPSVSGAIWISGSVSYGIHRFFFEHEHPQVTKSSSFFRGNSEGFSPNLVGKIPFYGNNRTTNNRIWVNVQYSSFIKGQLSWVFIPPKC